MALYLAEAAETYLHGAVRLMPPAHRPLTRAVLQEMAYDLRRWMLGQSIDMLAVGGLTAVGLYFLGVPVPFALAVLAGLLTIVPYFGALAAGIPGVLVALTQSWMAAVWVVLIFVGCHAIEGYIIAPLVQHRLVRMPPAVVIGALVAASALFGPVGIILGTPLAVVTLVLVRRVYLEHMLGDPVEPTSPLST
jgi:predicted PurR-regulated permease PerM